MVRGGRRLNSSRSVSGASAYENKPWIRGLEEYVRTLHKARRPVLGICFGHQILSKLNGGRVKQSKHREFGLANIYRKNNIKDE